MTTPQDIDKELDEILIGSRIVDFIDEDGKKSRFYGETVYECLVCGEGWGRQYPHKVDEAKAALKALLEREKIEARINPFDFVEPCEPDCSPERHAYHQGQWDMAGRINKSMGFMPYPGAIECDDRIQSQDSASEGKP